MYRLAESTDLAAVHRAAVRCVRREASYLAVAPINVDKACANASRAISEGNAYIVGGYFVLAEAVSPWYSDVRVLQESLVMRVYPGGNALDVAKALQDIAARLGCSWVATGDMGKYQLMAKAYLAEGFQPQPPSFYKGVPNG